MVVTLMGDSLTAGNLGIGYIRYLDLPPEIRVVNRGVDGDTVPGIRGRLDEALRSDGPEVLVIQAGANDILLPEMAARGGSWLDFVEKMIARGSIPSPDPTGFAAVYADILNSATAWGLEKILCVTIPPIGENLADERNRKRGELNRIIRGAAQGAGALTADVAMEFENILAGIPVPSDWFFESPADFTADARAVRRGGAEALAESRGLYLTMDGAHLNERGAAIAGNLIGRLIQSSRQF